MLLLVHVGRFKDETDLISDSDKLNKLLLNTVLHSCKFHLVIKIMQF